MNPLLAYIDTRPLIFVAGWLLVLLLWLGARKIRGYRGPMLLSAVAIHLGYGGLFILLVTGWGPYLNQKEVRTMPMQWQICEESPTEKAWQRKMRVTHRSSSSSFRTPTIA